MFFYVAIIGATMMMVSKIQLKYISERKTVNTDKPVLADKKRNNFFIKLKNTPLYNLFYSIDISRNLSRVGTLLVLIGIAGMIVSTVIKLILGLVIVVMIVYFLSKFVKNSKKK